jgi:dTDP-4-dehydrorhamnose reductase
LSGLYHVAAEPISKADLLAMIACAYGRTDIKIVPDDEFAIDRSLDASHFFSATGYRAPSWTEMIDTMHDDHEEGINRHV